MLLTVSFVFLPVVIVLVMSRIFSDSLLKRGTRASLLTFGGICLFTYAILLYLIAQVDG